MKTPNATSATRNAIGRLREFNFYKFRHALKVENQQTRIFICKIYKIKERRKNLKSRLTPGDNCQNGFAIFSSTLRSSTISFLEIKTVFAHVTNLSKKSKCQTQRLMPCPFT